MGVSNFMAPVKSKMMKELYPNVLLVNLKITLSAYFLFISIQLIVFLWLFFGNWSV